MKQKPQSRSRASSKVRSKARSKSPIAEGPRTRRLVCLLTEKEEKAIARHMKKYKVTNRSAWVRETLLRAIFKKRMEDYPMLFEEAEMRS